MQAQLLIVKSRNSGAAIELRIIAKTHNTTEKYTPNTGVADRACAPAWVHTGRHWLDREVCCTYHLV